VRSRHVRRLKIRRSARLVSGTGDDGTGRKKPDYMARLLSDHFGKKCFQSPEVSKCVDIEGSGVEVR